MLKPQFLHMFILSFPPPWAGSALEVARQREELPYLLPNKWAAVCEGRESSCVANSLHWLLAVIDYDR